MSDQASARATSLCRARLRMARPRRIKPALKSVARGGERIGRHRRHAERVEDGILRQTAGRAGRRLGIGGIRRSAIKTQRRGGHQGTKRANVEPLTRALRAAPGDGIRMFLTLARIRANAVDGAFAVAIAAVRRMSGHKRSSPSGVPGNVFQHIAFVDFHGVGDLRASRSVAVSANCRARWRNSRGSIGHHAIPRQKRQTWVDGQCSKISAPHC